MHAAMAKFHGAIDEGLAEVNCLASLTARWSAMLNTMTGRLLKEKLNKWASICRKSPGSKAIKYVYDR